MYTLIAYKPNSDDYCRGCHMATYSSDLCVINGLNDENLLLECADFLTKNKNLDYNEDGYQFAILFDDKIVIDNLCDASKVRGEYESDLEFQDKVRGILEEAEDLAKKNFDQQQKAKKEQEEKKKIEKEETERINRKKKFEELKKEFGD